MAGRRKPYSQTKLNEFIAQIGQELAEDYISADGGTATKEEALARVLYQRALGWTEIVEEVDEYNNRAKREVRHPPEVWAIQYLMDRKLGRVTPAAADTASRRAPLSETVRDIARERLNRLAAAPPPPPRRSQDA